MFIFDNARNPRGYIGRIILRIMNGFVHEELGLWAISHIEATPDLILDIGCGGGGNIHRLLDKFPHAFVSGIDYSPISVKLSRELNATEIEKGRCHIELGDVHFLHAESDSIDVITAFETIYYWTDIEQSLKEIFRTLKPNGIFVIANGADADGGWTWDRFVKGMHTYSATEIQGLLSKVGFVNINVLRRENHFLCVIASKIDKYDHTS